MRAVVSETLSQNGLERQRCLMAQFKIRWRMKKGEKKVQTTEVDFKKKRSKRKELSTSSKVKNS